MLSAEHKRLVDSYIGSRTWVQDADGVLRRKDDSDWAESALYDAVWEQPAVGWELIREISRSANSTEILEELANGPLHQLLVEHPEVLSDIETDARSQASVRALLGSLWEEQPLPQGVKARVLRASEPEH
jgi:hypothetical protein